jgi:hypothetical protein
MPDGVPRLAALMVGAAVCYIISILVPHGTYPPSETLSSLPSHMPASRRISLVAAFLCGVGAILLIPWAAQLPLAGRASLLLGTLFVLALSVAMLYAQASR